MADVIEGGAPEPRRRSWTKWIILACLATCAAAVALVVVLLGGDNGATPASSRPPVSPAAACTPADVRQALHGFVTAWNLHDERGLARLLTADAELDMSSEAQRALPPARGGGYTSSEGWHAIRRFIEVRWRRGERLSFDNADTFPGGVVATGMLAKFSDGTFQPMVEAKFAFDCASRGFKHIVIGAGEVAR